MPRCQRSASVQRVRPPRCIGSPGRTCLLACILGVGMVGCAPGDDATRSTTRPGPTGPRPLPLPDAPEALVYLASPASVLEEAAQLGLAADRIAAATDTVIGNWIDIPRIATAVTAAADWSAPMAVATLEAENSETLMVLHLRADAISELEQRLASLPPAEVLGARLLAPETPSNAPPALIAIEDGRLLVAATARGLVTAPALLQRYARAPIHVQLGSVPGVSRLGPVTAKGTLDALEITAQVPALDDELAKLQAQSGAMTSLSSFGALDLAGAFAWTGADALVREIIVNSQKVVDEQPFLIRGVVEEISRRTNALLRTWDGRVMAGVAGDRRILFALGSEDPKTSGVALLRLVGGLAEDLALVGKFIDGLPTISLRKNVGDAANEPIHRIRLGGLKVGNLPAPMRGYLDSRGRIELHVAFSRRTGAGMFVVGEDGLATMRAWLKHARDQPDRDGSQDHLLGLRLAFPLLAMDWAEGRAGLDALTALAPLASARTVEIVRGGPTSITLRYTRGPNAASAQKTVARVARPDLTDFSDAGR